MIKVVIEPPINRTVTITMNEREASILRDVLGEMSLNDWTGHAGCTREEAEEMRKLYSLLP